MHQIKLETFHFNVISMTLAFLCVCVFWMRGAESEQAENSCSSASIESLFGAKGFSGLRKSLFTGGRSASRQKPQRQRRICRNRRRNAATLQPKPHSAAQKCSCSEHVWSAFFSFPCCRPNWTLCFSHWFPTSVQQPTCWYAYIHKMKRTSRR